MEHRSPLRSLRLVQELEPGLGRRAIALAAVARHAGANDVFPRRLAAAITRDDVVEIEVLAIKFVATILAGVVIALEDVMPRKLHFLLRHAIEEKQQDDLRHSDGKRNRADYIGAFIPARKAEPLVERHGLKRAAVGFNDLRVALVKKHEGALDAADVDGLPKTIEHEDVVAQDRFHDPFQPRRALALG